MNRCQISYYHYITIVIGLLVCIVLSGCDNPSKVWDFTIGQSKESAIDVIENNGLTLSKETGNVIETSSQIKYLGTIWNGIILRFSGSTLISVGFQKSQGQPMTSEQKKTIVRHIDRIYGEHETDKSLKEEYGTVLWNWTNSDIKVQFISFLKGRGAYLVFYTGATTPETPLQQTGKASSPNEIYIFNLDQSFDETREIIQQHNLNFSEDEHGITIKSPITFLDLEWAKVSISKYDNSIRHINFCNNGTIHSTQERQKLIQNLDELYGEHITDPSVAGGSYTCYYWYPGNIKISYLPMPSISSEDLEFTHSK